MTQTTFLPIVLAAGLGTRMRSTLPKVLHPVGQLPMVGHVLKALRNAGAERAAVVVGPQMEALEQLVAEVLPGSTCHVQTERLGTAHATLAAAPAMEAGADEIMVLYGDCPLVQPETIKEVRAQLAAGSDVVVVGFEAENPHGYGRLLVSDGQLTAIREEKDASEAERKVTLCNSGIMAFKGTLALELLKSIGNDNAQGEYYLPDAVELANARGLKVSTVSTDEEEVQGVNNRLQLSDCEAVFQRRCREAAMLNGVTLLAPETVFFSHDTLIEQDVVVEQNVVFGPGVTVKSGAFIRAFSHFEGAVVGEASTVGPYARLRPGADLSANSHIGNFVEIKKATIGEGAKVNHLSYIGDAHVGAKSNIGAGTITCNYDGFGKHLTEIGAGSFVGSNSTLVAPLKLGDGVYVAAGSVVTKEVTDNSLVIGRAGQVEKTGRADLLRARFKAAKEKASGK
ncbi:MAG: bifunctional UDP-N-acetylglucosamine diphosphorylase/glucosamine-1-phosphate N-acetyltransferase GlmU [Rhodobacteraceae bacterium]|nr:bifunctional UDP-N-acetylglucosamine diphosphorylase/glucosamine-1-phosphate N-acetyltransferase GlmU [Paracoccaceae bacterium]